MENSKTQNASPAKVEDPGEEPDGGGIVQGHSNITTGLNNNPPFLPDYPCSEGCVQCGEKIADPTINEEGQPEIPDTLVDCSCECHRQSLTKLSLETTIHHMHIPPGGPNCLPGCGYSGLPCYNCSVFENNSQLQESAAVHCTSQGFPTQIYTVELMNPNSLDNFQSQGMSASEHRICLENEESLDSGKRRRTCISLVFFVIAINVGIAVLRLLVY